MVKRRVKRIKTIGGQQGLRKRPIYGAFPHELSKRMLSKIPVIFSRDSKGRLEGVEIFRAKK